MVLETTATQNMIASYRARFMPNPVGEGYLFSSSDYGFGAPCSTEKYQSYTTEFEQFVTNKARFMKFWIVFIIILSIPFVSAEFLEQRKGLFEIMSMIFILKFPSF